MAGLEARAHAMAERRAAIRRAELAEGWRALSGLSVEETGGEVIVEGRRLRLRALTDPAFREVGW